MHKEAKTGDNEWGKLRDAMAEFMRTPPQNGVQTTILKGPTTGEVHTSMHTFVGIFLPPTPRIELVVHDDEADAIALREKLLALRAPFRIKSVSFLNNSVMAAVFERDFSMRGLPTFVIAIGNTKQAQEEFISMYSLVGKRPDDSLAFFQDRLRDQARMQLN